MVGGGGWRIKIKFFMLNMEIIRNEFSVLLERSHMSHFSMAYGYLLTTNAELRSWDRATWPTEPRTPLPRSLTERAAALLHVLILRTVLPATSRVSVLQAPYFQAGVFCSKFVNIN